MQTIKNLPQGLKPNDSEVPMYGLKPVPFAGHRFGTGVRELML
jgi:hypothetical protein